MPVRPGELSDADVFGSAMRAPVQSRQPIASQNPNALSGDFELSDEDVFGPSAQASGKLQPEKAQAIELLYGDSQPSPRPMRAPPVQINTAPAAPQVPTGPQFNQPQSRFGSMAMDAAGGLATVADALTSNSLPEIAGVAQAAGTAMWESPKHLANMVLPEGQEFQTHNPMGVYRHTRDRGQAVLDAVATRNPGATVANQIGGAVLQGVLTGGVALSPAGKTAVTRVMKASGVGGLLGMLSGSGNSRADMTKADEANLLKYLTDVGLGGLIGAGAGGALQSIGETGRAIGRNFSSDVMPSVVRAADEEGIRIPAAVGNQSPAVRRADALLNQSALAGSSMQKAGQRMDQDFAGATDRLLEGVSPAQYGSRTDVGQQAQAMARAANKEFSTTQEGLFGAARQAAGGQIFNPQSTLSAATRLRDQLSKGAVTSGETKVVLDKVEEVINRYGSGKADIEGLINDRAALNSVIDFEAQGGAKNLLKGLVRSIDNDLDAYAKTNDDFAGAWAKAMSFSRKNAPTVRSDLMRNLVNTDTPGSFLGRMNSVDNWQMFTKAIGKTPEGQNFVQAAKRAKLEEILGGKAIKSALEEEGSRQVAYGNVVTMLDPKGKQADLIKALVGPEQYGRVENLWKVARAVQSSKTYYNPSKSGATLIDFMLVPGAAGGALLTFSPAGVAGAATVLTAPRALARMLSSEKAVNYLTRGLAAKQAGNLAQSDRLVNTALSSIGLRATHAASTQQGTKAAQDTDTRKRQQSGVGLMGLPTKAPSRTELLADRLRNPGGGGSTNRTRGLARALTEKPRKP